MKQRLSGWKVPVRRQAAERHLAVIEATLDEQPRPTVAMRPRMPRRLVYVTAALVIAILPTGAAIAAEGSVPGDFLYPVKRVAESIRSVWDSDVVARHRVDELQALVDRGLDVQLLTDAIADAQHEVDSLVTDHPLRDRLTDLLESDRLTDAAPTDQAPSKAAVPTDQAASDAAMTDAASQDPTDTVVAADWPPLVVDLLLVFGSTDFDIEALPDEIRDLVVDILGEDRAAVTGAELDALLGYSADHPELFEPDAPPTDSESDATSGGSGDSTTTTGGDLPHD